ncbi:DNA replication complex GINS family protein [Candidatus Woesearchaeota archaeon]|nr:DNA replication complex GINS family protein [Candidatus Woesearchaeota archaeon]
MGEQKDIIITYETLYELLRLEKIRPELQRLDGSFLSDCANYVAEKARFLEQSENSTSLFSSSEGQNTRLQLMNVKKLLKELYERREKKIIQMAMDKSRSPSAIIDTSSMLREEQEFFANITLLLSGFREAILNSAWSGTKKEAQKETTLVRFLQAVPKFVGKELEVYGPFREDDMANLPAEIASVLIRKGSAEEVSSG